MTVNERLLQHGIRLRRYDEGEEWRPVEGWPYEVSSLGNVRRSAKSGHSTYVGKQLKQSREKVGYFVVNLSRNSGERWRVRVHKLVAMAFHGACPEKHAVRHLNGNHSDNRSVNLAWGTWSDNAQDAIRHKRMPRGARHGQSKLTSEIVRRMRRLYRDGATYSAIAQEYNVSRETARRAIIGENWGHVK
jgi:hypothetical protein